MSGEINGAGGTSGGLAQFFAGLGMMGTGFYMLLSKITVSANMNMGQKLYQAKGIGGSSMNLSVTTGMIFIPLIIGIIWIFFNAKSIWGWALSLISLAAMIFGVISNTKITLQTMSSFDLIMIFILAFGGLGLFFKALKKYD